MKALHIAGKDFQLIFRKKGTLIYLFLLPLFFIGMFALLGSAASPEEAAAVQIPLVNHDPDGSTAQALIAELEKDPDVEVVLMDEAEARQKLSDAQLRHTLIIPTGFSAAFSAGEAVDLTLLVHPNHEIMATNNIMRLVSKAARTLQTMDILYSSFDQLEDMQAANPEAAAYFEAQQEAINAQIDAQVEKAETDPLVRVIETTPVQLVSDEEIELPNPGQMSSAGFAVLFVFLAAQSTAQAIFEEKKAGSFRRLLAAPIGRGALLMGKLLPNLALTLVQIIVIALVGAFVLPLLGVPALDYSGAPLALALTALLLALCSTSLGIFIAALVRSENQVSGVSTSLLWIAGMLGGSMLPSYMLPDFVSGIARILPHYWANQAFFDVLFRGRGLADIQLNLIVLAGFTAVFLLVGIWRFDFD